MAAELDLLRDINWLAFGMPEQLKHYALHCHRETTTSTMQGTNTKVSTIRSVVVMCNVDMYSTTLYTTHKLAEEGS